MSFVVSAFTLAGFCVMFGFLSLWSGYKSGGFSRSILLIFAAAFFFLSLFAVLVGLGFSVELTNQAPCENVVNTSFYNGSVTAYTWVDSCASRNAPESIERLYQAYAYVMYTVIIVSVLALMFLGLREVVFKW